MKRLVREPNTVEMLEAFEGRLGELKSSTEVECSTEFIDSWEKLETKEVRDFDGFWTEYSIWFNHETGKYIIIFGDTDLYNPTNSDPDVEFGTNADEAWEWFDSYTGFKEE